LFREARVSRGRFDKRQRAIMKCSVDDLKIASVVTSETAWAKEVVNCVAATQISRFIAWVRMNG